MRIDSTYEHTPYEHIPVMLAECRQVLGLGPGQVFCDCTLGGAGHSLAIAADVCPDGTVIGIDQDQPALIIASERISMKYPQLSFIGLHGNFGDLDELLIAAELPGVDAFLFDLGVSSPQLDTPGRGFSYAVRDVADAADAPLDMRMNNPGKRDTNTAEHNTNAAQTQQTNAALKRSPNPEKRSITAAEIVNSYSVGDLTRILQNFGEERFAPRIAQFIARAREQKPLTTTTELAELVKSAIPASARRKGGNPAKRTFQALRIAVNRELDVLKDGLEAALRWLNPGGRIAVLSYHSLEDRIVKQVFATAAKGCVCPPELPVCGCGREPILIKTSQKPLRPSETEIAHNPRASSAKLRFAVKK